MYVILSSINPWSEKLHWLGLKKTIDLFFSTIFFKLPPLFKIMCVWGGETLTCLYQIISSKIIVAIIIVNMNFQQSQFTKSMPHKRNTQTWDHWTIDAKLYKFEWKNLINKNMIYKLTIYTGLGTSIVPDTVGRVHCLCWVGGVLKRDQLWLKHILTRVSF